jgi:tetratricopeptide (TPR) repeat protein
MTINVRFLVCLLVTAALGGAGTHFLHGYQVKRNAGALLVQAGRAEQEAEAADPPAREAHQAKAVQHLRRYLAYRPADTQARARLGRLLETLARSPEDRLQALLVYDQVLRRDPEQAEVRLRAIRLAVDPHIARYSDALEHLNALGAADSRDGELQGLYGQCQEALGHYEEARERYARAVERPPVPQETYVRYAVLLRRQLKETAAADEVMEKMIRAYPTASAYLALSEYWKVFDPSPAGAERAARAVAEARKRAPDDADVLLQSADLAGREGGRTAADRARRFLRRGIEVHPKDARLYRALARHEAQSGRHAEALAALRRGLEAAPGEADLLWDLADLLIGDGADVADLLDPLQKGGVPEVRLEYLRARVAAGRGEWRQAAEGLERVRPDLESWPDLVRHADLLLGSCYEKLGDIDQQYSAYHRVVTADPLSLPGGLGLGAALEALGKADEALQAYQVLLHGTQSSEVPLRMARLLLRRNQERPRAERQWEEVDRLLDEAAHRPGDPAEGSEAGTLVTVVRAQALAARGQPERAEAVLTAARNRHPKDPKVWVALASLAEQGGRAREAAALLDQGERAVGDTVELRLARAAAQVRPGALRGKRAGQVLARLAQGLEKFSPADRKRLLRGLAAVHTQGGDRGGAVRLWSRVAELEPTDLRPWIALFDLAQEGQDRAAAARAVEEIRRIEGVEGFIWKYARAALLVEEARAGGRDSLAEARGLLEAVTARRPGWSRPHLCAALLEELAGNEDVAIARYRQAIDLGDRSPSTVRRAVQLMYARRRFAEADEALKKLPGTADLPPDLQRLTADVWLNTRSNPEPALELARQAVPANSRDYRAHLWLGQRLGLSVAHADEVEKELRRALALAETQPETWVALVQHLARSGKKDEATALTARAEAKLPRGQSQLALARCCEAVGQPDRARALYREALAARPDDVAVLTGSAQFYLHSNDLAEAESCLTRVVRQKTRPEETAWARRTLAFLVHARGNYQDKRKALALLGILDNVPDGSAFRELSPEDVRARACLLATQWERRRRREAIRLLEALAARQPLTADDQFLLGKLYESVGQWSEASKRMSTVLSGGSDNPSYLAVYVDSLLRHKEGEAAAAWLARLEARAPAALATLQLKARLLHAQGKGDEAVAAVKAYAATADADLARAARLLEIIDRPAEAEKLYRKYVARSREPRAALVLAAFHGRQGQITAALDECARAAATCPAGVVAEAYMDILAIDPDPRPHCERVERWVRETESRGDNTTDFTSLVAALRYLQGRYAESAGLYKRILVKDPYNARALNNLAYLLALNEGNGQEALRLLDRAQDHAGPSPTLADTRAVVYLRLGETGQAVEVLEDLLANAPTAEAYYHLAQAHELARDRNAARDAFARARELRLKPTDLSPQERPGYEQTARLFETR